MISVFFVKSLKLISDNNSFDITKYIKFSHNQTRSGSYKKLVQPLVKNNRDKQFYFNRLPYLWNSLPPIDLSLSFTTIKRKLTDIFWNSFLANFNTDNNCAYYSGPYPGGVRGVRTNPLSLAVEVHQRAALQLVYLQR